MPVYSNSTIKSVLKS
uniref:Uncharacterized protein n=1 Tax=Arundo donax TaxID=35708 RepID=A0A0A9GTH7_ARUDO